MGEPCDAGDYTYVTYYDLDIGKFITMVVEFPVDVLGMGDNARESRADAEDSIVAWRAKNPEVADRRPLGYDQPPTRFTVVAYREDWARYCGRSCHCLHASGHSELDVRYCISIENVLHTIENMMVEDALHNEGPGWEFRVFVGEVLSLDLNEIRERAAKRVTTIRAEMEEKERLEQLTKAAAAAEAKKASELRQLDELKAKYEADCD